MCQFKPGLDNDNILAINYWYEICYLHSPKKWSAVTMLNYKTAHKYIIVQHIKHSAVTNNLL